jgi:hypothetical protein
MRPPPPTRCPRCGYLPASATVICLQCRSDRRGREPGPQCPYTLKPCDCGLKAYCMSEVE